MRDDECRVTDVSQVASLCHSKQSIIRSTGPDSSPPAAEQEHQDDFLVLVSWSLAALARASAHQATALLGTQHLGKDGQVEGIGWPRLSNHTRRVTNK